MNAQRERLNMIARDEIIVTLTDKLEDTPYLRLVVDSNYGFIYNTILVENQDYSKYLDALNEGEEYAQDYLSQKYYYTILDLIQEIK
jgi:hypothetical protein